MTNAAPVVRFWSDAFHANRNGEAGNTKCSRRSGSQKLGIDLSTVEKATEIVRLSAKQSARDTGERKAEAAVIIEASKGRADDVRRVTQVCFSARLIARGNDGTRARNYRTERSPKGTPKNPVVPEELQ